VYELHTHTHTHTHTNRATMIHSIIHIHNNIIILIKTKQTERRTKQNCQFVYLSRVSRLPIYKQHTSVRVFTATHTHTQTYTKMHTQN